MNVEECIFLCIWLYHLLSILDIIFVSLLCFVFKFICYFIENGLIFWVCRGFSTQLNIVESAANRDWLLKFSNKKYVIIY